MIEDYYPDLQGVYQSRFASKAEVNGVTECTYVNGVINNIADFGIFVRLPNHDNGLLHKSSMHTYDIRFESGHLEYTFSGFTPRMDDGSTIYLYRESKQVRTHAQRIKSAFGLADAVALLQDWQ